MKIPASKDISSGWKPINFTGTYGGSLYGMYNEDTKMAIVAYNSGSDGVTVNLTMDVKAGMTANGAMTKGGYLNVNGTTRLAINVQNTYEVGQVVFYIK